MSRLERLFRLFAKALLDNDLINSDEDLHAPIASLLATFLVGSAVVVLTFIGKYNSVLQSVNGVLTLAPDRSLSDTLAMALDDKALVLGAVMAVMGLVTVLCWDALALDARDLDVLSPLPVPRTTLLAAKVFAMAGAAGVCICALNALPAALLPIVVLAKAPVGLLELLRWSAAQFTAGVLGCLFVFSTVVVCRNLTGTLLTRRAACIVLPVAQGALVLGFLAVLLTSPLLAGATGSAIQSRPPWLFFYPPFWFLGVEEVLIRARAPIFGELARAGVTATVIALVGACTVTAATLVSGSHRGQASGASVPGRWMSSLCRLLARLVVRDNVARATFLFTAQTLTRSPRHRVYLAGALGVGVAIAATTVGAAYAAVPIGTAVLALPSMMLAAQQNLIFFLVVGIRAAAALPADLDAGWIFRFHATPALRRYLSGTRRAVFVVIVLPVLTLLLPIHVLVWGWHGAAVHFSCGAMSAVVLLVIVFARYQKLPFVSSFTPRLTLVSARPILYLLAYLAFVYLVPETESLLLAPTVWSYAWLTLFVAFSLALLLAPISDERGDRVPVFDEPISGLPELGLTGAWSPATRTDEARLPRKGASVAPPQYGSRILLAAIPTAREKVRPLHALQGGWRDLVIAWRRLIATPRFLLFALLSLALGISVTTTAYSLLAAVLWPPIRVAVPDRALFLVSPAGPGRPVHEAVIPRADFDELRFAQTSLTSIAASAWIYQTLVGASASEGTEAEAVTGDYFATVQIEAMLGRTIQPRDDETAAAVIVLSHRLWRTRFSADPAVVGRAVRFGGHPFEIVGVMPRGFEGIHRLPRRAGAWISLGSAALFDTADPGSSNKREGARLLVVGRLAKGVSVSAAASEVAVIGSRLDSASPLQKRQSAEGTVPGAPRRWSARAVTDLTESQWRTTALVLVMAGLVLTVACTNLANLILARGAARQREVAIRRALGATRLRLIRELCMESALLAAFGGIAAYALTQLFLALLTVDLPLARGSLSIEPRLNLPSFMVGVAALLLSILVVGLEPAVQLTREGADAHLAGGTAGIARAGRQRAFIRWQVAISATFLLIAAGLARVVVGEARHDSGIDLNRLAIATVPFPEAQWKDVRLPPAITSAVDLLRQDRNLESVSIASGVPFGLTATPHATFTTPDRPFSRVQDGEFAFFLSATPEIFRTLGVPILRGRAFDARDGDGAPKVIVLSEKVARAVFGTSDAVGRQILARSWGRPPNLVLTIVGITRDTDTQTLMSRQSGIAWVPLAQHYDPHLAVIIVRTVGPPDAAALLIQSTMRRGAPDAGIGAAGPASVLMSGRYFGTRVAALVASALGALTLILAMIGLYGVQSHLMAQRTREIGVRMAIGANRVQIQRMVLREGYRPVLEGLMLGLFFGVVVRIGARAFVTADIDPFDAGALALVSFLLSLAAFLSCYLPARRAAHVDPNMALRHD